jgi:CHASE3 domain sensor protein
MAAWLPIIKVVLPYIAPIFQAAIPAFTKKKSEKADPLVSQQITELQEAVKTNSESTRALARAIEEAAQANDKAMKRMRLIAIVAVVVAMLSLVLAIVSLLV